MSERDSKGRFCKAEPRAFRVGDRVRGIRHSSEKPEEGVITRIDLNDPGCAYEIGHGKWLKLGTLTLLSPAPQPKAEVGKRLTTVDLAERFTNELGEALGQRTPWSDMVSRVAAQTQEIATLKAEVEHQKGIVACTAHREKYEQGRAAKAEAKLDDIKALLRAMKIMSRTPGDEPSFQDAMWHVGEN